MPDLENRRKSLDRAFRSESFPELFRLFRLAFPTPRVSRWCHALVPGRGRGALPHAPSLRTETTCEKSGDLLSSEIAPSVATRAAVKAPEGLSRNSADAVLTVMLSLETLTATVDLAAGSAVLDSSFFWHPATERQLISPSKRRPVLSELRPSPDFETISRRKSPRSSRISVRSFRLRENFVRIFYGRSFRELYRAVPFDRFLSDLRHR